MIDWHRQTCRLFRSNYPVRNIFKRWFGCEKAYQHMQTVFRLIVKSSMMLQQLKVNEKNINITLFACPFLSLSFSFFFACVWQTRIRVVALVLFFSWRKEEEKEEEEEKPFFSLCNHSDVVSIHQREKASKSPKHVHQNHDDCMRFSKNPIR